ncbi:DUF2490 domain-containing protein [Tenacibaculum insulae]|uniref:DUF2490 domain-containing protein n=1 Tax=Tenacibaculum insulae TaxID=2029677 RepID=UPI003AB798E3
MKKTILFLTLLISISIFSQKNPEKDFGAWYMYNGSHQISDKFSLKSMAHFRFFEFGDDLRQFIARVGGSYKINNNLSATLGYAYLNTDNTFGDDGGDFNEHRIYEDFNIKHTISKLALAHRFRAEQRFLESDTSHFVRYQLNLSYPITNKLSIYLYDEVFFDSEGEAYNQNWIGSGFKYKVSNKVKLQLGYQRISINKGLGLNRVQIGIAINTDHRKKK